MKRFLSALFLVALLSSCSSEKTATTVSARDFLIDKIASVDRISDVRTFTGDSLSQYVDLRPNRIQSESCSRCHDNTEIPPPSKCREVATADYKKGESEMTVEIYRFNSSTTATKLFHHIHSGEGTALPVGTEGYVFPGQLDFIKGIFMVRITGFDDSETTSLLLAGLATDLSSRLPSEE